MLECQSSNDPTHGGGSLYGHGRRTVLIVVDGKGRKRKWRQQVSGSGQTCDKLRSTKQL